MAMITSQGKMNVWVIVMCSSKAMSIMTVPVSIVSVVWHIMPLLTIIVQIFVMIMANFTMVG